MFSAKAFAWRPVRTLEVARVLALVDEGILHGRFESLKIAIILIVANAFFCQVRMDGMVKVVVP
jgi:hypothetical protein